ncbi:hypothetical protein NQ318_020475 [Aromia moschata]|uniref:DNA-directed RNA polymerase, mitochondrial n=1 Tax=Aromia moschata TaxID=1265417 RepID=A0AAV8YKF4_9CUCU|nr:hypothetical protein NQ318_020475 [Aromia moschata]
MYRLLKLSGTPLRKHPRVSFGNFTENGDGVTEKTCMLCKQLNNFSSVGLRNHSTIINPNISLKKVRKRKQTVKKYAELLVVKEKVTDKSSSQHKASIQKLTSSDLKLLASTSLNLSELYKLKELSKSTIIIEQHTYNNLSVIENMPNPGNSAHIDDFTISDFKEENVVVYSIPSNVLSKVNESFTVNDTDTANELPEEGSIASEADLDLGIHSLNTFQPEAGDEQISEVEVKEANEKDVKTPLNQKYKVEIATKTLAAYIERQVEKEANSLNSIKNINVYKALLKAFAHKGDLDKIKEILKIMEEENVELNLQCYVAIFECLGRVNIKNNHLKDIRIFAKNAFHKGITFDKMMNEGSFLNNEREIVLQAMKSCDPSYVPKYDPPRVIYNNTLVNHLNNPEQQMPANIESNGDSMIFNSTEMRELVNRQIEMEKEGYVTVKSIEARDNPSEEILKYRGILDDHYKMWEETALAAFNRDLTALIAQKNVLNLEPYMRCIPVQDYVAIIIDEAKKLAQGSETYSPTVNMLYKDMGTKVYARYKILRKQKTGVLNKIMKVHNKYCEEYATNHSDLDVLPSEDVKINTRQRWQWLEHSTHSKGATLNMDHREWVPTTLQFIGKFMYHIVMHDLKIDVNAMKINNNNKNYLPAFYTIFRTQGRIVKEEVKPHPVLSKLYRASVPDTLTFPTYELPMVCPPVPWIATHTGGYLVSPCDVIRLPSQAILQKRRLARAGSQQLYPSLDALNQLAAVPWKVNKRILDVILEVFNSGGSASLDVPQPSSSLPPPSTPTSDMEKSEKYHLFRQKLQYKRKKAEMYSLWCDCLYRLSLANHFRDEIFWLPHNMDFRGRVYPIPPHLNHLGSDLARSMLVFAESRPLGPNGLDWLKLHLINLTGLKKRDPLSERQFANEIMDLILDSADNPLTGKRWWVDSDEPWQTLACCMEIANVGRDSSGAYSVNLTQSEVPQDVYSAVVALVEKQRAKDAESGLQIAKVLEGFVKRKVIKQTVMTTVYGVTRFGARLQIARQLKDIDDFPKESVWPASSYLTGCTFDSLRSMFTSTREIQDWFTECARLISAVGCKHVEWVTPLGLPIVQPYFRYKQLKTPNDNFPMDKYEKPNVMKQKNAFPPNFIHSLDSSHMMLTSLHCERAGITFVSVHDCYWTHPSTVHIMNKICREQFVALHSQPILEDLSLFLADKYSYDECDFTGDGSVQDLTKKKLNRVLRQLPKTGDFDIRQVLNSVYFFS